MVELVETRLSRGASSPLANEPTWCNYDSGCTSRSI